MFLNTSKALLIEFIFACTVTQNMKIYRRCRSNVRSNYTQEIIDFLLYVNCFVDQKTFQLHHSLVLPIYKRLQGFSIVMLNSSKKKKYTLW